MADTLLTDILDVDVYSDMVQAEFLGKTVWAGLSQADNTLVGRPGSTIHFPRWSALADAAVVAEGVAMVPEKMGTTDDTATIYKIGKAVELTDEAVLSGFGDPLGEAARQTGVTVARKVDTDLAAEADAFGSLQQSYTGGSFNAGVISDAITKFGDESEISDFAALVVHSAQVGELRKSSDFLTVDKMGGDATLVRGTIGSVFGIPVVVSDRSQPVPATPTRARLVRRGALGLIYKRTPITEQDRDILAGTTVLATNVHYAVKRLVDRYICLIDTAANLPIA